MMKLGVECLLEGEKYIDRLQGKRVSVIGVPASVDHKLNHTINLLMEHPNINVTCAFGAQHGLRGEAQDNMIETEDYVDPVHGISVFSLYGKVRRPTKEMMGAFDVALFDLQGIGTRIYTFITTLGYMLEACAEHGKELWVLDRPNPIGRPIEGLRLVEGEESFVGLAPMAMRHGLTAGELARWYVAKKKLDVELTVVHMDSYDPTRGEGYGWPLGELSWVNPSPNIPTLASARVFPGTVLLEGTTLSEGRGTTRALEVVGAPDIDFAKLLKEMADTQESWMKGCLIRECFFEPTFHKHVGKMCHGLQFHVDTSDYHHLGFKPFRMIALLLKTVRKMHPDYEIWRDFDYEYGGDRWAIDMLNGGPSLREWVDDRNATVDDLETMLIQDEAAWGEESRPFLIYPH